MSMPFLIVGLGNPGSRYSETRHNAGFWFLDRVAAGCGARLRPQARLLSELARVDVHGRDCLLVKPVTFMNRSGQAVRAVMDYYRVDALATWISPKGNIKVIASGKNLTEEETYVSLLRLNTFGAVAGYPNAPRTYSLEVQYDF